MSRERKGRSTGRSRAAQRAVVRVLTTRTSTFAAVLVIGPAVAGGVIAVLILAALIYCLHKRGRSETILASNSGLKS